MYSTYQITYSLQQQSLQCDQWCYFDHGNDRCPSKWDAADNAGYAGFYNLKNLVEGIRTGKRKPGEGITSPFIQDSNKTEKMEPVKQEKVWSLYGVIYFNDAWKRLVFV